MAVDLEKNFERWTREGLIEASTADLIRAYERDREKAQRVKWPIVLAIALGGLLLAAGIVFFVVPHWDMLSHAITRVITIK